MTEPTLNGLATLAVLMARGCEDRHLEPAFQWLTRQQIPDSIAEVITHVDEAISIARAMDP